MRVFLSLACVAGAVVAGGCALPNPYTAPQSPSTGAPTDPVLQTQPATTPEAASPAQPLPAPTRPRTALSPATQALVAQAQTQLQAGNDAQAAATLERAMRIEPDNPLLWIELAKVRQEEGNAAQAENLARKALSMSGGDAKTQAAAWRVIAQSYRARGRNPEAREADAKAKALAERLPATGFRLPAQNSVLFLARA